MVTTRRYGWSTAARKTLSNIMPPFPARSFSKSPVPCGLDSLPEQTCDNRNPMDIKILASKPQHAYQERHKEIEEISAQFDKLKTQHGADSVRGVYIKGVPGIGKTQLAREFGEHYHRKLINSRNWGISGKIAVVAMLDARTPASLMRSYLHLAENLGFPVSRYNAMQSSRIRQRVAIISSDVRIKLAESAPDWLLIVDGIDVDCKLLQLRI